MPKVSVIIPTYQCATYVSLAVKSVLTQTYRDFDVIVVNDGSTDNTLQVLAEFNEKIQVITQANGGSSAARNTGIRATSSEYIAFLDADDFWLPHKLEQQMPLFEEDPKVGLVFGDILLATSKGVLKDTNFKLMPPSKGMVFHDLFKGNFIPATSVVIRRCCIDEVGFFDEGVLGPEDYDLWLRISQAWNVAYVNEPVAIYRISPGQLSANNYRMMQQLIRVKSRIFNNYPDLSTMDPKTLEICYYNLYIRAAKLALMEKQPGKCRSILEDYRSLKRPTYRYWLLFFASWLPLGIGQIVTKIWNRIHRQTAWEEKYREV
jgi:glycosyltransferase involved in cell wall biosynthesis